MRKSPNAAFDLEYFRQRSTPDAKGCWIWNGAKRWNGYGAVRIAGKTVNAHRAAFEVANGVKLLRDIDVCHRCDVRDCVNPDHLFQGSRKVNMQDCASKGRVVTPNLKGDDCPNSVLTAHQVLAIRANKELSQRGLARAYGVHHGTISHILKRKTWRHI